MVDSYNPQYTLYGTSPLVFNLKEAYDETMQGMHKLPDWILQMPGMSGVTYRKTVNNLVNKIANARYLEVGCWQGSTTCAAVYKNDVKAYCIDNWSQFNDDGSVRAKFAEHVAKLKSDQLTFVDQDYMVTDFSNIGKYNIYLFDGPHEEYDQYMGVLVAQSALEDEYILIVDDWNWEKVRKGTYDALNELKSKVLFSVEIRTSIDDTHPVSHGTNTYWHNGVIFAVIKK